MLDLGRVWQGRELGVAVELTAAPDDVPACLVHGGAAVAECLRVPADQQGDVAAFRLPLRVGSKYPAFGPRTAVVYWTVAGVHKAAARTFWVIPGGDVRGAVIAMHTIRRPDATRLVRQLDSGLTVQGRNPR